MLLQRIGACGRRSFAWSRRQVHASYEGRKELPLELDDDQAEAIGIMLTVKGISKQRLENPQALSLHSRCNKKTAAPLYKLLNPSTPFTLQLRTRDMKLSGANVVWTRPE